MCKIDILLTEVLGCVLLNFFDEQLVYMFKKEFMS